MNKRTVMFKVFWFLVWSVAIIEVLNFLLVQDPAELTSAGERIMMHEFYNQDENIDVLLLGSSHVYCSMDPRMLDERTGKNTFVASSSGQTMDVSLVLLQKAIKEYEIEEVYLEMYFEIMSPVPYHERENLFYQYTVADYMKPSFDRVAYLF